MAKEKSRERNEDGLTERMLVFIDEYLKGKSISAISKETGISRTSLQKYKNDKIVIAEIEKRKRQIKKDIDCRLLEDSKIYVKVINEIASDKSLDPKIRLDAAVKGLEFAIGKATTKVESVVIDNNVSSDLEATKEQLEILYNPTSKDSNVTQLYQ